VKTAYKKRFLKDADNLPDQIKKDILDFAFKQISEIENIQDINNLKKLSGFKNFYRIRYSDYRIGIVLQKDKIVFMRVLHRKDIYNFFP
jgi:mRNA interferase RelE/StbE